MNKNWHFKYEQGMFKYIICLMFSMVTFSNAYAQSTDQLRVKLRNAISDTGRISTQLQLARLYLLRPGASKTDLDSALLYIRYAEALSKLKGANDQNFKALSLEGEWNVEFKNLVAAELIFTKIASHYNATGEIKKEASVWNLFGDRLPLGDTTNFRLRLKYFTKAQQVYLQHNYKSQAIDQQFKIATENFDQRHLKTAEIQLLSLIAQYKASKNPKIYKIYSSLAEVYYIMGEREKAFLARIETVNSYEADPQHLPFDGMQYYFTLAVNYFNDAKFDKALVLYQKSVETAIATKDRDFYFLGIHEIIACYINLKEYNKAFAYLKKESKRYPVKSALEESMLLSVELKLYNRSKNNAAAEKIIPRFKSVFGEVYMGLKEQRKDNYYADDNFVASYAPLTRHYFLTRQWNNLLVEVKKLEALPTNQTSQYTKLTIYQHRYELDSAKGDFFAALKGFRRIMMIQDSLKNFATTKQINELETKYNSAKKDRAIDDLNKQAVIQKSELEKSNLQRDVTLWGTLIIIIFAALLYLAYRNKQRSNRELRSKQEEINHKNNALSGLLAEKDDLLLRQESLINEKEWLLKEVHHRVKNNLQIVMSLLYTQSAYLKNNAAIEALQDSQNRVHAISIIHQKLYSKTNVAAVVLAEYIEDLVRYLRTAFVTDKIRFRQDVELINLDISQAVPIGLIINEAVTNCIKYAFPAGGGEITIEGRLVGEDMVLLSVMDNGIGLPDDFDVTKTTSLGLEMMKALSKQLDGTLGITNNAGVMVAIQFTIDNSVKMNSEQQNQLS